MNAPSKHVRDSSGSPQQGLYWAARASSVGMQLAVPAGLGFLADRYFNSSPGLTIIGVCFGFVLAMLDLYRLVKDGRNDRGGTDGRRGDSPRTGASASSNSD